MPECPPVWINSKWKAKLIQNKFELYPTETNKKAKFQHNSEQHKYPMYDIIPCSC